jgi:hypothetical protein
MSWFHVIAVRSADRLRQGKAEKPRKCKLATGIGKVFPMPDSRRERRYPTFTVLPVLEAEWLSQTTSNGCPSSTGF